MVLKLGTKFANPVSSAANLTLNLGEVKKTTLKTLFGERPTFLLLSFSLDELAIPFYPLKLLRKDFEFLKLARSANILVKEFHSLEEYLEALDPKDGDPALFSICPIAWHFLIACYLFERGFK